MPTPIPTTVASHDVLIAGAGPVGLFLACELGLAGCSVLVLERASDPASPLKHAPFGLRGLTVPTLEALDRRGLLDEIRAGAAGRETPGAHWARQARRPGGHFAGIPFHHDRVDAERWPYRPEGSTGSIAVEMATLEAVLSARARALGVVVLGGRAVEEIAASEEGVVVRAGGAAFAGRWLVGCDGARSRVRKAAGIGFAGTEPEFTGYSIRAELAGPDALDAGRRSTAQGMVMFTPPDTIAMADFDRGACHRSAPITRAHVEAVLRRISGRDVRVARLSLATTWTDRACQAQAYRAGRVLLAGDAAHVHAPLGGQGLNLGLGDAMNLGWKLAAVVRGDAPRDLLDSYERERRPIGARVLDWSRAQVALMRPGPGARALESVFRDLIETRDGATYVAGRVWGVDLRYDLGDDPGGNGSERHPLTGCGVPPFAEFDGTGIAGAMRDGRGLLLDLAPGSALRDLAAPWSARVAYRAGAIRDWLGLRALLVRPDGIVAWACEAAPDAAALTRALTRWFGDGVTAPAAG